MSSYEEYAGLGETGYEDQEPVKPEDEFFHALYIAGNSRENHAGITEQSGKLQIRGVEYNLDTVNMVITHVKKVLVKSSRDAKGREKLECFSYKKEPRPPWHGFENRVCGSNSAERAADQWCQDCREQIVVAGIYCDAKGKPILSEEKKPVFIFLRGKGMKYSNVSEYLGNMFKLDLEPIFQPVTEESKSFEKKVVNNKRFVTQIGMGKQSSNYGDKDVFTLTHTVQLENKSVLEVLKIAKQTQDKFNEKMDWTRTPSTSGYAPQQAPVDQSNVIPEGDGEQKTKEQPATQPQQAAPKDETFNFEDISF